MQLLEEENTAYGYYRTDYKLCRKHKGLNFFLINNYKKNLTSNYKCESYKVKTRGGFQGINVVVRLKLH